MNIHRYIVFITFGLSTLCGMQAAESATAHSHERKAGPNGGRLIAHVSPPAEFFVTADRFVQITFLSESGDVVAPAGQEVSLIGGDRANPVKLGFAAADGVLRSTEPLPELPNMPIIVSIKSAPDAQTVREKFYLNQSVCGGCGYEEYACTCGH